MVYGNPETTKDGRLNFGLKFWIGLGFDDLAEFFRMFDYMQMHENALDDSHADYLVFGRESAGSKDNLSDRLAESFAF